MSMNLIAILVSLAMMLTGAGGAAQPDAALPTAETARTLTLSNLNVSWNGETLRLDPQAHIGVSTDGKKAVYDFSIELGDKKLLPMQLSAGEKGVTALYGNSGVAVTVAAEALASLAAQLEEQMNASMAAAGGEDARIMQFITEEYMPAYTGMLKLAMDPAQRARINDAAQAVFDRVVDRGEGKPAELEVEGARYDVKAYSYSMDAMQMAALTDAEYREIPELNDYYGALFKLYGMLPEESGLRGLDSFTALFERFGVQMRLDVEEQRTDDGAVDQMDAVLTLDLNSMMSVSQGLVSEGAAMVEPPEAESAESAVEPPEAVAGAGDQMAGAPLETGADAQADVPEAGDAVEAAADFQVASAIPEIASEVGEAPEIPALPPIVMNMHSLKLPEYSESTGSFTYAVDATHSVDFSMTASESEGVQEIEAKAIMSEDGKRTMGGKMSAFMAHDEMGTVSYSVSAKAIKQDSAKAEAAFYGVQNPDGTSENSVAMELHKRGVNASASFDLNVTADAIEDAASAAKPAFVIEDLSQEGIEALGRDTAAMGTLMQALGGMLADFNTLKADPGLKNLRLLMRGKGLPIDVDELDEEEFDIDVDFGADGDGEDGEYGLVIGEDGSYELVPGNGDAAAFDTDDAPVEDDGVLAFEQPRMGWLPGGWSVANTETDTAYDWVQMTIVDAQGAECAYAIFFLDPEAGTANYIVQDSGKVLDGRMMNVTDFGEGGLSVTVSENGMYGNLMFNSEAIELDTVGKIVAGIEF